MVFRVVFLTNIMKISVGKVSYIRTKSTTFSDILKLGGKYQTVAVNE